jgi:hypothetical protein
VPAAVREGIGDIQGTFWLDRSSAELRLLEYRYTNLIRAYAVANPGGFVEFLRLPTGNWFVSRWEIRMPLAFRAMTGGTVVDRLQVAGGEITVIERAGAQLYHAPIPAPVALEATGAPSIAAELYDSLSNKKLAGTIDGVVTDTNLVPVPSANVTILSSSVRVETGDNGRFRILRVPAGRYLVIVRRLGFAPVSAVVQVRSDDTLRLSYALEPAPQTLGSVVVTEERRSRRMAEFDYHRKLGFGEFMAQDDIEKHNFGQVTDVMRLFHSINVVGGAVDGHGAGGLYDHFAVTARGKTTMIGNECSALTVLVDGVPMPTPFNLDLLPPPRDLAGIEVFARPATTPAQYLPYDRGCGLILVWTKDGS